MADTTVKFFHSGMPGHPVLTGQPGSFIALLDACLVNGFGLGTLDSLVVTGNVATATRAAGHPFEVGSVVLIAGATPAALNGEQKVVSTTTNSYTFATSGIADQTATGSISHKLAPAGWSNSAMSGGTANVKAYKSTDVAATGCLLRVDDAGTQSMRLVGYETMSDVNTGTNPFPTSTQVSGGAYWAKSTTADATERQWALAADGRSFLFWVAYGNSNGQTVVQAFGDFLSLKSPDAYACYLSGALGAYHATTGSTYDFAYSNTGSNGYGGWAVRGVSGLGSSQPMARGGCTPLGSTGWHSGYNTTSLMAFPNPADNGLYVTPLILGELSPTQVYRGSFPGFFFAPQNIGSSVFALRESVTGVTGLTGKTLKALTGYSGVSFVDVTGPWR